MGVTRRIIFPTIRLILWAVIAAALVKIAFAGADVSTVDTSLHPTGAIVEPTVEVATATVTNAVTVQASVTADPAVVVRATLAGTVSKLLAADGAAVAVGHADPGDPPGDPAGPDRDDGPGDRRADHAPSASPRSRS